MEVLEEIEKKVCTKCNTEKVTSKFHKLKLGKDGLNPVCNLCRHTSRILHYNINKDFVKKQTLSYERAHEEQRYGYRLKANYGITLEDYNKLLILQDYKCKICNEKDSKCIVKKRLSVDHDHKTGKVRGLLCDNCNKSLGLLRDNPIIVANMLKYIQNG